MLATPRFLRPALVGLIAGALVASLFVGVFGERLLNLLLVHTVARAVDHLELRALAELTSADFEPPYTSERLEQLARRLESLRQQVVRDGSGIIRLNLFARDGTLLYSDLPGNRGHHVDSHDVPLLAIALAGGTGSERSSLTGPENADLRSQYASALEVYVPVIREGQVVGAYEVYQDIGPVTWLLVTAWGAVTVVIAATVWIALRLLRPLAASGASRTATLDAPGLLTARERDVLRLLAHGLSNRAIATDLAVGEETVRSHVKHILRKLEQPDRTAAVAAAMRIGLLRLEEAPEGPLVQAARPRG